MVSKDRPICRAMVILHKCMERDEHLPPVWIVVYTTNILCPFINSNSARSVFVESSRLILTVVDAGTDAVAAVLTTTATATTAATTSDVQSAHILAL